MRRMLGVTTGVFDSLAGQLSEAAVRNDRGAPLDPQAHALLTLLEQTGSPRLEQLPPEEARTVYRRANELFGLDPQPVEFIEDRSFLGPAGRIDARVYRPRNGELPGCVYFHGGGFVVGGIEGYDALCRVLARRLDCVVVSVDYRLAPEHPFPAGVEDACAGWDYVIDSADQLGIDPRCIAIAGDSAGANLATVVCQHCAEESKPLPARQLLIYPMVDQCCDHLSRRRFAEGFYLTQPLIEWFSECCLAGADGTDPRVSPLHYADPQRLPPAMVVTAGFDPLRDEGEAYARRLEDAGVNTIHRSFDRLIHGFVTLGGVVDAATRAVADIAEEFRQMLRGTGRP